MLLQQGGHIYICGDCKMAEDVQQKLKEILQKNTGKTENEILNIMVTLMVGE